MSLMSMPNLAHPFGHGVGSENLAASLGKSVVEMRTGALLADHGQQECIERKVVNLKYGERDIIRGGHWNPSKFHPTGDFCFDLNREMQVARYASPYAALPAVLDAIKSTEKESDSVLDFSGVENNEGEDDLDGSHKKLSQELKCMVTQEAIRPLIDPNTMIAAMEKAPDIAISILNGHLDCLVALCQRMRGCLRGQSSTDGSHLLSLANPIAREISFCSGLVLQIEEKVAMANHGEHALLSIKIQAAITKFVAFLAQKNLDGALSTIVELDSLLSRHGSGICATLQAKLESFLDCLEISDRNGHCLQACGAMVCDEMDAGTSATQCTSSALLVDSKYASLSRSQYNGRYSVVATLNDGRVVFHRKVCKDRLQSLPPSIQGVKFAAFDGGKCVVFKECSTETHAHCFSILHEGESEWKNIEIHSLNRVADDPFVISKEKIVCLSRRGGILTHQVVNLKDGSHAGSPILWGAPSDIGIRINLETQSTSLMKSTSHQVITTGFDWSVFRRIQTDSASEFDFEFVQEGSTFDEKARSVSFKAASDDGKLDSIVSASFGPCARHTFIISKHGRCRGIGYNDNGQLGLSHKHTYVDQPETVDAIEHETIVQIACGHNFSYFLSADGRVLTCGSNCKGQLGISHTLEDVECPTALSYIGQTKRVAAGGMHAMMLMDNGDVFTCGDNIFHQCGVENTAKDEGKQFIVSTPKMAISTSNIVDIAAGETFSAALDNAGNVLVWGRLGQFSAECPKIMKFDVEGDALWIAAGQSFLLVGFKEETVAVGEVQSNGGIKQIQDLIRLPSASHAVCGCNHAYLFNGMVSKSRNIATDPVWGARVVNADREEQSLERVQVWSCSDVAKTTTVLQSLLSRTESIPEKVEICEQGCFHLASVFNEDSSLPEDSSLVMPAFDASTGSVVNLFPIHSGCGASYLPNGFKLMSLLKVEKLVPPQLQVSAALLCSLMPQIHLNYFTTKAMDSVFSSHSAKVTSSSLKFVMNAVNQIVLASAAQSSDSSEMGVLVTTVMSVLRSMALVQCTRQFSQQAPTPAEENPDLWKALRTSHDQFLNINVQHGHIALQIHFLSALASQSSEELRFIRKQVTSSNELHRLANFLGQSGLFKSVHARKSLLLTCISNPKLDTWAIGVLLLAMVKVDLSDFQIIRVVHFLEQSRLPTIQYQRATESLRAILPEIVKALGRPCLQLLQCCLHLAQLSDLPKLQLRELAAKVIEQIPSQEVKSLNSFHEFMSSDWKNRKQHELLSFIGHDQNTVAAVYVCSDSVIDTGDCLQVLTPDENITLDVSDIRLLSGKWLFIPGKSAKIRLHAGSERGSSSNGFHLQLNSIPKEFIRHPHYLQAHNLIVNSFEKDFDQCFLCMQKAMVQLKNQTHLLVLLDFHLNAESSESLSNECPPGIGNSRVNSLPYDLDEASTSSEPFPDVSLRDLCSSLVNVYCAVSHPAPPNSTRQQLADSLEKAAIANPINGKSLIAACLRGSLAMKEVPDCILQAACQDGLPVQSWVVQTLSAAMSNHQDLGSAALQLQAGRASAVMCTRELVQNLNRCYFGGHESVALASVSNGLKSALVSDCLLRCIDLLGDCIMVSNAPKGMNWLRLTISWFMEIAVGYVSPSAKPQQQFSSNSMLAVFHRLIAPPFGESFTAMDCSKLTTLLCSSSWLSEVISSRYGSSEWTYAIKTSPVTAAASSGADSLDRMVRGMRTVRGKPVPWHASGRRPHFVRFYLDQPYFLADAFIAFDIHEAKAFLPKKVEVVLKRADAPRKMSLGEVEIQEVDKPCHSVVQSHSGFLTQPIDTVEILLKEMHINGSDCKLTDFQLFMRPWGAAANISTLSLPQRLVLGLLCAAVHIADHKMASTYVGALLQEVSNSISRMVQMARNQVEQRGYKSDDSNNVWSCIESHPFVKTCNYMLSCTGKILKSRAASCVPLVLSSEAQKSFNSLLSLGENYGVHHGVLGIMESFSKPSQIAMFTLDSPCSLVSSLFPVVSPLPSASSQKQPSLHWSVEFRKLSMIAGSLEFATASQKSCILHHIKTCQKILAGMQMEFGEGNLRDSEDAPSTVVLNAIGACCCLSGAMGFDSIRPGQYVVDVSDGFAGQVIDYYRGHDIVGISGQLPYSKAREYSQRSLTALQLDYRMRNLHIKDEQWLKELASAICNCLYILVKEIGGLDSLSKFAGSEPLLLAMADAFDSVCHSIKFLNSALFIDVVREFINSFPGQSLNDLLGNLSQSTVHIKRKFCWMLDAFILSSELPNMNWQITAPSPNISERVNADSSHSSSPLLRSRSAPQTRAGYSGSESQISARREQATNLSEILGIPFGVCMVGLERHDDDPDQAGMWILTNGMEFAQEHPEILDEQTSGDIESDIDGAPGSEADSDVESKFRSYDWFASRKFGSLPSISFDQQEMDRLRVHPALHGLGQAVQRGSKSPFLPGEAVISLAGHSAVNPSVRSVAMVIDKAVEHDGCVICLLNPSGSGGTTISVSCHRLRKAFATVRDEVISSFRMSNSERQTQCRMTCKTLALRSLAEFVSMNAHPSASKFPNLTETSFDQNEVSVATIFASFQNSFLAGWLSELRDCCVDSRGLSLQQTKEQLANHTNFPQFLQQNSSAKLSKFDCCGYDLFALSEQSAIDHVPSMSQYQDANFLKQLLQQGLEFAQTISEDISSMFKMELIDSQHPIKPCAEGYITQTIVLHRRRTCDSLLIVDGASSLSNGQKVEIFTGEDSSELLYEYDDSMPYMPPLIVPGGTVTVRIWTGVSTNSWGFRGYLTEFSTIGMQIFGALANGIRETGPAVVETCVTEILQVVSFLLVPVTSLGPVHPYSPVLLRAICSLLSALEQHCPKMAYSAPSTLMASIACFSHTVTSSMSECSATSITPPIALQKCINGLAQIQRKLTAVGTEPQGSAAHEHGNDQDLVLSRLSDWLPLLSFVPPGQPNVLYSSENHNCPNTVLQTPTLTNAGITALHHDCMEVFSEFKLSQNTKGTAAEFLEASERLAAHSDAEQALSTLRWLPCALDALDGFTDTALFDSIPAHILCNAWINVLSCATVLETPHPMSGPPEAELQIQYPMAKELMIVFDSRSCRSDDDNLSIWTSDGQNVVSAAAKNSGCACSLHKKSTLGKAYRLSGQSASIRAFNNTGTGWGFKCMVTPILDAAAINDIVTCTWPILSCLLSSPVKQFAMSEIVEYLSKVSRDAGFRCSQLVASSISLPTRAISTFVHSSGSSLASCAHARFCMAVVLEINKAMDTVVDWLDFAGHQLTGSAASSILLHKHLLMPDIKVRLLEKSYSTFSSSLESPMFELKRRDEIDIATRLMVQISDVNVRSLQGRNVGFVVKFQDQAAEGDMGPFREMMSDVGTELWHSAAVQKTVNAQDDDILIPSHFTLKDAVGVKDFWHFLGVFCGISLWHSVPTQAHFATEVWGLATHHAGAEHGQLAEANASNNPRRNGKQAAEFAYHITHSLLEHMICSVSNAKPTLCTAEILELGSMPDGTALTTALGVSLKDWVVDSSPEVELERSKQMLALFNHSVSYGSFYFRQGLCSMLPSAVINLLTGKELRDMVNGNEVFDVDELKSHTAYRGTASEESSTVSAFWNILNDWAPEMRFKFLKFAWGRDRLPRAGQWQENFKLNVDSSLPKNALPKADTCFFTLTLPEVEDESVLRSGMEMAIKSCIDMDADEMEQEHTILVGPGSQLGHLLSGQNGLQALLSALGHGLGGQGR